MFFTVSSSFAFNNAIADTCVSKFLKAVVQVPGKDFGEREYSVLVPNDNQTLDVGKAFGSNDQMFLGISKKGHFYLMVGKTRKDGAFFPIPVMQGVKSANGSEGYLIHFKDVPSEKIAHWQENMRQKSSFQGFSVSCVQTACSALRNDFDIKIAGYNGPHVFSSPTFMQLLKNGFVDSKGNKIAFEIVQTSRKVQPLGEFRSKLESFDSGYARYSLFFMAGTGSGVYLMVRKVEAKRSDLHKQ